jgi:hypothetical protein
MNIKPMDSTQKPNKPIVLKAKNVNIVVTNNPIAAPITNAQIAFNVIIALLLH